MATVKTAEPGPKPSPKPSPKPGPKAASASPLAPSAGPAKAPTRKSASTNAKTPVKSAAAGVKPQPTASIPSKTDKKKDKPEKVKVLRDSFTIPKTEFAQIAALKKRAMALGQESKKSELIRAGLLLLGSLSDTALLKALTAVPTLKTGRPGKA